MNKIKTIIDKKLLNQSIRVIEKLKERMTKAGWAFKKDMSKAHGEIAKFKWAKKIDGEEEILIWTKGLKLTNVWRKGGSIGIHYETYLSGNNIKKLNEFVEKIVKKDLVTCSYCHETINKEQVVGKHFAGRYCEECW